MTISESVSARKKIILIWSDNRHVGVNAEGRCEAGWSTKGFQRRWSWSWDIIDKVNQPGEGLGKEYSRNSCSGCPKAGKEMMYSRNQRPNAEGRIMVDEVGEVGRVPQESWCHRRALFIITSFLCAFSASPVPSSSPTAWKCLPGHISDGAPRWYSWWEMSGNS